jgi:hypothetical protein
MISSIIKKMMPSTLMSRTSAAVRHAACPVRTRSEASAAVKAATVARSRHGRLRDLQKRDDIVFQLLPIQAEVEDVGVEPLRFLLDEAEDQIVAG